MTDLHPPAAPIDRTTVQRQKNTAGGPVFPIAVPWPAVAIFIVIALGLAWLVQLPVWLSGDGLSSPLFGLTTAAMMFTPTIAAFIVVLFVKRPPNIPRLLGLSPLRPIGRTLGFTALALFGIPVLVFLAMILGHVMGLIRIDLNSFSGFVDGMNAAGQDLPDGSIVPVVVIQLAFLPISILMASLTAFGEELGWRGWLLPALRPLGTWPALVITGVVWGLWHAPVILLGYNYGRTDVLGVLLMTGWCVLLGVVIGWLRLRSASVWPAVIAHGAVNAATASFLILFLATGQGPEAVYGSILGWSGWIVLAVAIVVLAATGQFAKQPQPGLKLSESTAAPSRR